MLGPIKDEVKKDEQLVRVTYNVRGGLGKVTRNVVARPVHALHISDERDDDGKRTEKTPDIDGDMKVYARGLGDA